MGSNSEHNWFMILTGYIMGSNGDRMGHESALINGFTWLFADPLPTVNSGLYNIYIIYSWIVVKFNIYI